MGELVQIDVLSNLAKVFSFFEVAQLEDIKEDAIMELNQFETTKKHDIF